MPAKIPIFTKVSPLQLREQGLASVVGERGARLSGGECQQAATPDDVGVVAAQFGLDSQVLIDEDASSGTMPNDVGRRSDKT